MNKSIDYLKQLYLNPIWTSILFIFFLITFEIILFQTDYIGYLSFWYHHFNGGLYLLIHGILAEIVLLVISAIFIWSSFSSDKRFRWLYFTIFALVIFIQYGYQNAFAAFMSLADLHTVLSDIHQDFLGAIETYLTWSALVPVSLYGLLLIMIPPRQLPLTKFSHLNSLALGLIVFSFIFFSHIGIFFTRVPKPSGFIDQLENRLASSGRHQIPTLSMQSFFDTTTKYLFEKFFMYSGPRTEIEYKAITQPANNIIFVIDESIRADHLSLNGYYRPTTPFLDALSTTGRVYNWGTAVAGATCSNQSVALLLTGVNKLPDTEAQVQRVPTIFQYAKAVNYHTMLLDGEASAARFGFSPADFEDVDEWYNLQHFKYNMDTDISLAQKIANLLNSKPTGNFIVILKKGVHVPYTRHSPADYQKWLPVIPVTQGNKLYTGDPAEHEALINSYDNALAYNINTFFQTLFDFTGPDALLASTLIYTSDHGQTLSDFGERYPHCGKTRNEAAVPLLLISAHAYQLDTRYRASHQNIFATLLDLMEFPEAERRYDYAQSLLKATDADTKERYYLFGSLNFGNHEIMKFD